MDLTRLPARGIPGGSPRPTRAVERASLLGAAILAVPVSAVAAVRLDNHYDSLEFDDGFAGISFAFYLALATAAATLVGALVGAGVGIVRGPHPNASPAKTGTTVVLAGVGLTALLIPVAFVFFWFVGHVLPPVLGFLWPVLSVRWGIRVGWASLAADGGGEVMGEWHRAQTPPRFPGSGPGPPG